MDGGGSDHAFRTQSEAGAADNAGKAVQSDPSRPIPTDINNSAKVEQLKKEQGELIADKQKNEKAEQQTSRQRQR